MTTSIEQIVDLFQQRRMAQAPVISTMTAIRDANNGDYVVPVPEMEKTERPAIANLISTGIDKTAGKIASVTPNLYYPPLTPGQPKSEKRAENRRRANLAWWEANNMGLKMRRRARHLVGYGSTAVILRPDMQLGCARWEVRDPLSAFPAPSADPDEVTPQNVIFQYQRTLAWLREKYPDLTATVHQGRNPLPDDRYDLLEYADGDETVLVVIGQPRNSQEDPRSTAPGAGIVELMRTQNRTGICLAVLPHRVTLDRVMGQFDQMLGMMEMQAKLNALDYIAVKKSVFPDMYLIGRQGETPRYISGPHDGTTGLVNVVQGGVPEPLTWQPGVQTNVMIDRLERNQRVTGGVAPEMGGESATNVRTGKRGDSIMAEVIDPVVQEAQEILSLSLREENRRAVALEKAYWGNTSKSFFFGSASKVDKVDYTPNIDFETDYNAVTYPMPGADASGLVIGGGQRIGLGTMSKKTFMEIDPQIADVPREQDRIQDEQLDSAILQSIQTQAANGSLPLRDAARIKELIRTDQMDLVDAVLKAQDEAQQRQAQQVPPSAPEAQPGLSMPGMGAEATPTVAPPQAGVSNLADLLGSLQRSGRPNRPAPVPQAG